MPEQKPPSKPRPWVPSEDKRNRVIKTFKEGGKGRKQCHSCLIYVPAPAKECPNCHTKFVWVGKPKFPDVVRVKDLFARKQILIDRINEVGDRATIEDLLTNVETKLQIIKNENEEMQKNFEIISISKSVLDKNLIKLYNFSIELSWKLKNIQLDNVFSESISKKIKSHKQINFLTDHRNLKLNILLSKIKDILESELETEFDSKIDIEREEKIIQYILTENCMISNPILLIEEIENSYKNNEFKKIKSIGWNWCETDDDFINKYCSINSIVNKFVENKTKFGECFDFCEMDI